MLSNRLRNALHRIEARPHSFVALLAVCTFTGIVRAVEEYLFFGEKLMPAAGIAMAYAYFHIAVGLVVLLSLINGTDWKRTQNAVYIGIFLGVFPPLIDLAVSGFGAPVIYRYYVEQDLAKMPWHFYAPHAGAPLGETITVWASILFAGAYSYLRRQSIGRALLSVVAVYGFMLLQFSFLPRALVKLIQLSGGSLPGGNAQNYVARLALSFLPFWYLTVSFVLYMLLRAKLRQLLARRLPHFVPFFLIALAGGHYTKAITGEVYLAAFAVLLLAATAAVENDYFDLRGRAALLRPEKCDLDFMHIVAAGLLFWLVTLGLNVALPLILIAVGAILYNYPQFRLRKIFPASLKIEGLWAAMAFLSGMLVFDRSTLRAELIVALLLIFGGWSVVAAWKDLKDFRSDLRNGYRNLYTWLYTAQNMRLHRAHRLVSAVIVACFIVPVLYAILSRQWNAAIALAFFGLVPIIILSFYPRLRYWFRIVLYVFSAEIVSAIFWLRV